MVSDNTQIPAYIICKEDYLAMIEADMERNKPFNSDPFPRAEYDKLRNEIYDLYKNKEENIDKIAYKNHNVFDLLKREKAKIVFYSMMDEKNAELSKLWGKVREEDNKRQAHFKDLNEKHSTAIKKFKKNEEDAFCKKVCNNPEPISGIVDKISRYLTYVGSDTRNEYIERSYYIIVNDRYIIYTTCNPERTNLATVKELVDHYSFDANGIETLKCCEHISGLKNAMGFLIKQCVESKNPFCMLGISIKESHITITSRIRNKAYVPAKQW